MATPLYSIRLNPQLKARLAAIAKAEGRTLSYVIDRVLTAYADRQEQIGGPLTKEARQRAMHYLATGESARRKR